jgi:hypothetical protein
MVTVVALRQRRLDTPGLKRVSGVLLEYPKVRYRVHNSLTFVLSLVMFVMELAINPSCRWCSTEEETSIHILYEFF